jgi:hypothetical protein
VSQWAYLNTHPYRVRHAIAEHFMAGLDSVVDVGTHRVPLDIPYVQSIDPTGEVPGAFHGTVGDWCAENPHGAAGIVALGIDVQGAREVGALVDLCDRAQVVVAESSVEHTNGMEVLEMVIGDRTPAVEMDIWLPMVDTPGYPPRRHRRLVVLL